ncbi:MAG: hypothetical protein MJ106_00845 [Lentisphaeria bacterium]|nr:hypothetical protein [Lentisphaeria bacterium]
MKAFNTILKQTIRSSVRSKVFIVLFALILLCVIGLPLTIRGDNTATGLVQVSLTYSLNLVIALVSASCLWLACSLISSEIEGYQVHMVVTKPCPKWKLWLGKFVGVFLMHALILIISMFIIYGLTFIRLNHAHKTGLFTDEDMRRLRQESLVARREFSPVPPNLTEEVVKEYDKRVREGTVDIRMDELAVKKGIMSELLENAMRNLTIKPGETHSWNYENVVLPKNNPVLYLRFRMYSNSTSNTDQRQIPIDFGFQVYSDENGAALPRTGAVPEVWFSAIDGNPFIMPGGSWQELSTISADQEKNAEGQTILQLNQMPIFANMLVDSDANNSVKLLFKNYGDQMLPDKETIPEDEESQNDYEKLVRNMTSVFQYADGPVLLCPVASFFENYLRTMLMALFQLAFLSALGTTVGALFSTPVAVFVAIAYIVIGSVVPYALEAPLRGGDGTFMYANLWEKSAHYMAQGVQALVVTVDDLACTGKLADGRLVETSVLLWAFVKVIIVRSGILALVGIICLYRRELGLVVRRIS